MAFKLTLGSVTYDSKKGQWTRAKKNRRKHLFEYESRTRVQRDKDRKERKAAKAQRRYERAQVSAQRRAAVQDRMQAQPARVTQVQAVSQPATTSLKALGGQGAAQTCGAPTKTGGRCMRAVAPGQKCPIPAHGRARR